MGKGSEDAFEESRETSGGPAGAARGNPVALAGLVRLQDVDGSWDLSRELADAVGKPLEEVEGAFSTVMDDVERRARLVDRAGELAGQSFQAWATVRTQQQEQELAALLRSEIRDLGEPLASISGRIDEARDSMDQASPRVLATLQDLLRFVESFRTDVLRKDALRRAFATALAVRRLQGFAGSPSAAGEPLQKARAWLQTAPLGAAFWLERTDRSPLAR
jgi:hypothetical protein